MSGEENIGIVIFGTEAQVAWCSSALSGVLKARRHFVTERDKLGETIRTAVPEIALLATGDANSCRNLILLCRRENPALLIIIWNAENGRLSAEKDLCQSTFAIVDGDAGTLDIIAILKKAFAFVLQKREQQELQRKRQLRRQNPAQWLMGEENAERHRQLEYARSLIRNILHSASQGLGIGAVLTYIDLLQMSPAIQAIKEGDETISGLVKNASAARQWLAAFENILTGLQKRYEADLLPFTTVNNAITAAVKNSEHFRAIKGHEVVMALSEFVGTVRGNAEAIGEIIAELLLNAYKYSPAKSKVRLMCYVTPEIYSVVVVSEIETMRGGVTGVPAAFEKRVFEPFFRLNNTWDDRFREQKYGLGIGLTLAEHAAEQCGARLYLYQIELPATEVAADGAERANRIVAELTLQRAG
ncbi:sensor histidine kinase [Turneriella parva]|uniref:ATP-binding region ATPase domain protein n=1 Tax=Turneriella parva (strain ATCC BAA-1111 / DSM 21527 / NCTC 11395 / H) TaxID=869212 RepID=I4BB28_TURPD|nr:ATP-binding protein [Turneriella parva]AFM14485.1 ATP-binding region ATPase domain protein [Turneriella parva DSM 21527]